MNDCAKRRNVFSRVKIHVCIRTIESTRIPSGKSNQSIVAPPLRDWRGCAHAYAQSDRKRCDEMATGMKPTTASAVAAFGAAANQKLSNLAASGEPEDQLRAPFETLLADLAELANIPRAKVAAVGESSLSELKTRPDYAVTVSNALVGFVELKAPGKGADPRKFRDPDRKSVV